MDYNKRIKGKIDDNFYQLDLLLSHEEKVLIGLNRLKEDIHMNLEEAKTEVEKFI